MHEKSKFDYYTHWQIKFVKETIAQKTCANEIVNNTCPAKVFMIEENCRILSRYTQNQKEKDKSQNINNPNERLENIPPSVVAAAVFVFNGVLSAKSAPALQVYVFSIFKKSIFNLLSLETAQSCQPEKNVIQMAK